MVERESLKLSAGVRFPHSLPIVWGIHQKSPGSVFRYNYSVIVSRHDYNVLSNDN